MNRPSQLGLSVKDLSFLPKAILFGFAYFLCATLSDYLEKWPNILSHFWLPSGLYLAALLLNRPARWPLLVVAAGLGDLVYNGLSTFPWPLPYWLFGHVGNTVGAVLGAWLVRRFVSRRTNLTSVRELVGMLAFGGIVGTSFAGLVGATAIRLQGHNSDFWTDFLSWYASDLLGVILFTPAVVVWWRMFMGPPHRQSMPALQFAFLQVALMGTVSFTFYLHLLRQADSLFVSLPFVIWSAARFGLPGATVSILLSTLTVNWFAAHGFGPYAVAQLSHPRRIIENLVSQGVFAFAGLLPAAVFSKLRDTQAREAVRARTMTLLSGGSKLHEILGSIVHGVEAEAPDVLCSIEVMDSSGTHLRLGAAPSMPAFFINTVHGIEIGPNAGCCGAAAFLNRIVVSEDIRTDPRWEGTRELAEKAGLRSCWAQPFHDSSNMVIGTIAAYYREPALPTDDERELISSLAGVAAMAVERKSLEEQFLRAQRMESIGTLAGGVAHDLNNLLTPISLCTAMLKDEELSSEGLELLESIQTGVKRGAELVKQVLTFARGVQGARIALNLRLVVNEVGSIATKTFPKNISFAIDIPRDLPLVVGDSTQMEQVLLNLYLNARDAMPNGGTIKVTGRQRFIDAESAASRPGVLPGLFVELAVIDAGGGMRPEIIDRVFEPFFTTKELGHGTGLGLSTSLGIVRSHGGFIEVFSKENTGSTFRVNLPAVQPSEVPETGKSGASNLRRGRGETLLVVDDEAEILKSAKRMLTANGYNVVTAINGAEALAYLSVNREKTALVITDLMMPVMGGEALIQEIRKVDAAMPIMTVSGLRTETSAPPEGSWHHMSKPFSAERLLSVVGEVLERSSNRGKETGRSRPPVFD